MIGVDRFERKNLPAIGSMTSRTHIWFLRRRKTSSKELKSSVGVGEPLPTVAPMLPLSSFILSSDHLGAGTWRAIEQ
jgi:hypothetical protein